MFCFRLLTLSCFLLAAPSLQAQQPANSFVVIKEDFNSTHLDACWQNAEGWYSSGTSLTNRFLSKTDASEKSITHDLKDCRNSVFQIKYKPLNHESVFWTWIRVSDSSDWGSENEVVVKVTPTSTILGLGNSKSDEDIEIFEQRENTLPIEKWHTIRIVFWGPFITVGNTGALIKGQSANANNEKQAVSFSGFRIRIDDVDIWAQSRWIS